MKLLHFNNDLLIPHCNHAKYSQDVWDMITQCKHNYIIEKPETKFIKFPGFVTDEQMLVNAYNDNVYSKLGYYNEFTPPRGNISTQLTHIICGFKPGHALQHLSKAETSWLFGPSSRLLHKLLTKVKIYPYFTNVYKNHDMKFGDILDELSFFNEIFDDIKTVFLGSYEEYDKIILHFAKNGIKYSYIKIWHPAYLVRSYTENKFKTWCDKLV